MKKFVQILLFGILASPMICRGDVQASPRWETDEYILVKEIDFLQVLRDVNLSGFSFSVIYTIIVEFLLISLLIIVFMLVKSKIARRKNSADENTSQQPPFWKKGKKAFVIAAIVLVAINLIYSVFLLVDYAVMTNMRREHMQQNLPMPPPCFANHHELEPIATNSRRNESGFKCKKCFVKVYFPAERPRPSRSYESDNMTHGSHLSAW